LFHGLQRKSGNQTCFACGGDDFLMIRLRKRKVFLLQIILFSFCLLVASGYCQAADWYVDNSVASSGNGTSWATAFKTITEAISAAVAGDTVNVAAGTYQERLVIDKQLTFIGAGWDSTVVQPLDTPAAGVYDVEIGASGTIIEDMQFDFNGPNDTRSGNGIVVSDLNQPPVTDVQILNNKIYTGDANTGIQTGKYSDVSGLIVSGNIFYGDSDGMGEGIYINPYSGAGKVTIQDNEIYGYLYSGISIEASNVDVLDNTVDSDVAKGIYGIRFIELTGGATFGNVFILYNNIQNVQYGISVGTSTDVGSILTATIQSNTLSANDVGLRVRYGADLTVTNNNISGNTQYGVSNETTTLIVAENNWWGDVSGPYHPVTNPAGTGDVVSDNVDYDPWITSVQANFTANPTSGVEPLTVSFFDTSAGPVDSWAWDFDNDAIVDSTEQNPTHTYTAAGTYTVSLTVYGALGSDIETKINYITVDTDQPVFHSFSPLDGSTGVSLAPTLTWTASDPNPDHTLSYDVYFGTVNPPPLVTSDQTANSYQPGQLSHQTLYYWRVVARDNIGRETAGPVLSFTTVVNNPPQFVNFSPPDGTTGVALGPTLSWTATDPDPGDTITYDVYFGSSIPPALKTTNQTSNSYNPGTLSSGSTYYWRIVARDNYGSETTGPLLSFTTLDNPPQFTSYSPADGATGVSLTPTLQWGAVDPDPGDIVRYDIYFGPSDPPPLVVTSQGASSYNPGQLTHETVYFWYIVARDNHGAETESPVQSFTTLSNPPQFVSFSPDDGSIGIGLTPTLSWTVIDPDPDDILVYDIYFGTTSPAPLVLSNQTVTTYQPGQLSYSTRYYWKVIARDHHGVETSMAEVHFDTDGIDTIVDHTSATVNHPQIATDGNGHIYVVWEDTRNGSSDIYLNYSSDYGLSWQTSDIRLDTDTAGVATSNSPQIGCDNSGHVYVVWKDERNGTSDVYFNVSSDYGATWLPSDRQLNTSAYAPPAQFPEIACDNSGHVYVAWNDNYFNTSADYGVNWLTQPIRISNSGGSGTRLICDQNGHVYVAWKTSDVLFNFSSDFGATWQATDRIVSSSGSVPYALSLDNDGSGHVYVTWDDGRSDVNSPDVYFNSSSDYGNTWGSSDIKLNTGVPGSTYSTWPEVASDKTGHVYVTWHDRRNGLGDIYLNSSSDYGTNWWASDIRIDTDSSGASDSGYPRISVDVNGYVYVTWNDDQGSVGGPGMYMNYSPDYGATWLSTNRKIGSAGFNPQITSDDSHLYIIRDNNHAIFTGIALFFPMYPSPADGAAEVSITPSLSWSGGNLFFDHMLTYDIYFGTSSPPTLVSSNQTGTTYDPGTLSYFTIYYWQVVSKDSSGTGIAGPIWAFTTVSNPPQFLDFSPTNGATGVETAPTLTWTAIDPDPGDTITYDVYFGNASPPALKETNQTSNTYNPSFLFSDMTYYWQVVARDNHGSETVGPVLSFTTRNNPPVFTSFTPDDSATGVSMTPTIKWLAYDPDIFDSKHYDVYFGESSPPPLVSSNQTDRAYSPGQLSHMTVYYWKVVVRDNYGAEVESPILSFTTLSNPPVLSNFSPANKSVQVSVTPILSWSGSDPDPDDTVVYDIYFGETNPPPLVVSSQTAANYSPGEISYSIKFFWKIVARDDHGAETAGPVLSFTTVSRPPEFISFTPADDATDVDHDPVLMWSTFDPDPEDKIAYDVYFGYAAKSLILVDSNRKSATYKPGVQPSLTTCYWKVVAKDNHGIKTVSPVLSFTIGSKPPKITNFKPANHATGVSVTRTLSWWAYDEDPRDTVTCDVYFGTSSDPPLVVSNQVSQSYSPGVLDPLTTYYWKIVARDNHGDEQVGQILSFTTVNKMIDSVSPNPCKAGRIVSILGRGFGTMDGTIHLGAKVFEPGNPRIKMWSDMQIDFRIPPFNGWPSGTTRTRKLWVTIDGVDSNKVRLKIRKPRD
jgi:PKD repeat protein